MLAASYRRGAWVSDVSEPTSAADPFDLTRTVGMLSVAVIGTALAGGIFPAVIVVSGYVASLLNASTDPVVDPAGTIIVGGMVGFTLALSVGFLLAVIAILVAWLCSLPAGAVWFESLVGGWTGFFTTTCCWMSWMPATSGCCWG
jgi:hypothetical protein